MGVNMSFCTCSGPSFAAARQASIVLYGFAQWGNYAEAPRQGAKYALANRPDRVTKRGKVAHEKSDPSAAAAAPTAAASTGGTGTVAPVAAGDVDSR